MSPYHARRRWAQPRAHGAPLRSPQCPYLPRPLRNSRHHLFPWAPPTRALTTTDPPVDLLLLIKPPPDLLGFLLLLGKRSLPLGSLPNRAFRPSRKMRSGFIARESLQNGQLKINQNIKTRRKRSREKSIPNWTASRHEEVQASLRGRLYPSVVATDRVDSRLHPLATPPTTRDRDPPGQSIPTSATFSPPTG